MEKNYIVKERGLLLKKFSLKTDGSGILHVKTEQIPPPEKEIFVGIKKG